jgi:CYTH domain-containing protein
MPAEIERKFLVNGNGWRQGQGIRICQGYLNPDKERTVRVRLAGEKAFLTVKGMNIGATRAEYEYPIPVSHAEELLKICDGPVLEKNRYAVDHNGLIWEVDEFLGENEGLIVAEVELKSEDQSFDRPEWVGQEVTDDPKYFNSNLCAHPFSKWQ